MFKIIKSYKFYVPTRCFSKTGKVLEMKYLNVAEKNDAAKTIAGQLSKGTSRRREGLSVYNKIYEFEATVLGRKSNMVMTSVSGHLLTFEFLSSYRNWNNVNPQSLFDAPVRKSCAENFQPIKRTLEREVRSCQGLIIWTDCDREGENIGFEIIDVCRAIKPNITVHRAIFSEITGAAVKRALLNLTQPDKRQSDAVNVRSELDLRTGAAITRFQTMRLQRLFPEKISDKLISYGSCQIPTLGFVAERYKEIEAFVSEPFWKIKVTHTIDDLTVEFLWARNRLFNKQDCENYYLRIIGNPTATVETVTVKPKSKWRPTPLDTVELEKLGSRKLKLSAKEVMTIAEKLYSKGIISYPRTETNMFSKDIDLRSLVEQQTSHTVWGSFAQRIMEWGTNPRNGNKSDQAHPPIHPTKMLANLDGNEGRVYELICRHFLACVSKDAVGSETIVTITIEGEKFTATGLVIYERNYLDVYIYDKWNAKEIHKYEQNQRFEPTEITMPEGRTTAPPLLTEADLIALMDKHGIGTDATHAEHINTIKERGYIGVVDKGSLVPGVIGMGLYEGYDAMELALAKPMLRAEFEKDLKKICSGEKDPTTVLNEQIVKYKEAYKQIMDKVSSMDEKMAQRILETPVDNNANIASPTRGEGNRNILQELFQCPKCSVAPLALKPKRNQTGYLIGCLNYPDCTNCIWWPEECKDPSVLNETCDKCGSDIKMIKLKFSNSYHKTMFNTPSGRYKTCLRCDTKFRNTFDINLESVKRVGPIVGEIPYIPNNYGVTQSTSAGLLGNAGNSKNKNPTKDKKSSDTNTETQTKTKKTRKTSSKTTNTKMKENVNSNIRSYFTAGHQKAVDDFIASELRDISIDEFFDSNDGFEAIVSSAEANAQPTTTTISQIPQETVLSDDLAAAFNDDDDDIFADFQWGSGNKIVGEQSDRISNSPAATTSTITRELSDINGSFGEWLRDDVDNNDDYVWGSAARNARLKEIGPTVKRAKTHNSETKDGDNNSWGSSSRTSKRHFSIDVKCTGCHEPAKELSVKKDGPNKGRNFFVCPKSNNSCKFFQWSDELEDQNKESGADNADDSPVSTTSWGFDKKLPNTAGTSNISGSDSLGMLNNRENINCNCNTPAQNFTVRKSGPNKGRDFYACSNRDKSCGFFQWVDATLSNEKSTTNAELRRDMMPSTSTTSTTTTTWGSTDFDIPDDVEKINCNCNKPANSLIVRKDGTNKGRSFYACANRNQSCGFFQWANQTANRVENHQRSCSSSSTVPSSNKKSATTSKNRKCGLCRQEGHTRVKCPRKGDFEF